MHGLTALDICVLLLIFGGAALGLLRGFVTEILSLFAWAASVVALRLLHTPLTDLLSHVIGTHGGAAVLAFAMIFIVVYVCGKLVAGSLGRRTRSSVLGPLDRALGFGFGAIKGLIIATLAYLLINLGYDTVYGGQSERPEWMRTSRTHPLLNATGRAIVDWVAQRRKSGMLPAEPVNMLKPMEFKQADR